MALDIVTPVVGSLDLFVNQTLMWVGKLLLAYVIWLIGSFLIGVVVRFLNRFDIPNMVIDNQVRAVLKRIFVPTAKVVLILVILDTLGIGRNLVYAVTSGITYTIAIALGLAFGRALEPFAQHMVGKASAGVNNMRNK